MALKEISIVVVDDDIIIRNAIKILIWESLKSKTHNLKLYSSKDGIDGLGLIHATNPDIVIVDSTLPRYSGREILNDLSFVPEIEKKSVIVLHDSSAELKSISSKYKLINKKEPNFVEQLLSYTDKIVWQKNPNYESKLKGFRAGLVKSLISKVITFSNSGDLLMAKIQTTKFLFKLPLFLYWVLVQFTSSFYYSLLLLLTSKVVDSNIKQGSEDLNGFRVKAYPSLIAFFTLVFFLTFQGIILFAGGVVVFNTIKLESIFAAINQDYTINLENSNYNPEKIQFVSGSLKLAQNTKIEEYSEETPQPDGSIAPVSYTKTLTTYDSSNPEIIFKESIRFDKLIAIYEESNLNTNHEDSLRDSDSVQYSGNKITYQLSPDLVDWYYFGSENNWEKTTLGFESSNTVQQVNMHLSEYVNQFGGGELYLKAFLWSSGDGVTELKSLRVQRELTVISSVNEPAGAIEYEEEQVPELNLSYALSNQVPASYAEHNSNLDNPVSIKFPTPTLFSASSFEGRKLIFGKLLNINISENELSRFKVRAYYTNSNNTIQNASDLGDLIGESSITRNSRGELTFNVNEVSQEGGFVTTQLIYINDSGKEFFSSLSKPMQS